MAANKIKFKMSIKEVSFEFEGDYEQGRILQQGISQTMTGLSNLQNRTMGLEDTNARKQIESKPMEPVVPRRRRKRKGASTSNEDGVVNADGEAAANSEAGANDTGTRRSSGVSPKKLLIELRQTGFFTAKREMSHIVGELQRKGYASIQSNSISGLLAKLAQKDVLRRDKNEQGIWVYTEGANEELPK